MYLYGLTQFSLLHTDDLNRDLYVIWLINSQLEATDSSSSYARASLATNPPVATAVEWVSEYVPINT